MSETNVQYLLGFMAKILHIIDERRSQETSTKGRQVLLRYEKCAIA